MTRDEITRMAREAGFVGFDGDNKTLREFAALVAGPLQDRIQDIYQQLAEAESRMDEQYKLGMEVERHACAELMEGMGRHHEAIAIRARGQA